MYSYFVHTFSIFIDYNLKHSNKTFSYSTANLGWQNSPFYYSNKTIAEAAGYPPAVIVLYNYIFYIILLNFY